MALSFSLRTSALPDKARVIAFRGTEHLGSPYHFQIWVLVEGQDDVELDDAVGSNARLIYGDGLFTTSSYGGVLAGLELVRAVEGASLYRAELVPALWQLSLSRHSRVFTKMSVDKIIEQVLYDEGITSYEMRLKGSYEVEEHVCQYKESSLHFLHRWMEREGIYYFFEQDDDGEKLIITDHFSSHAKNPQAGIPYHPAAGTDWSAGAHFRDFIAKQGSAPARVTMTDYDYAKPSLEMVGQATVQSTGSGEFNISSGRFFTPAAGARLANIRAEALRSQATQFFAKGPAARVSAGFTFGLERHPKAQFNQDYLAVAVEHSATIDGLSPAWAEAIKAESLEAYSITVTAIKADVQYRLPERSAWPRIDGYESGIVDGEATSDYAQIDDAGRYLVRFKFDEQSNKHGKASTFVRMMQPHAGAIEGWHFPLRKGTEVTFFFLGGDPDRPVIAGAIPNAVTPSPVTSGNHTRNVIQTGGRNRFELEDLAGQQRVTLSTPHANTYLRMGFANEDHELIAKTDLRGLWCTGDNTDFNILGHWWIEVDKDKKEVVTGAVVEEFKSTKNETVTSKVTEAYNDGQETTIKNGQKHTVSSGGQTITVTGNHMETLNDMSFTHVKGATMELHDSCKLERVDSLASHSYQTLTTNVDNDETRTVGGKVTWTVTNNVEITCLEHKVTNTGPSFWTTNGPKHEWVYGIKNDLCIGMVTEEYLGKAEVGIFAKAYCAIWDEGKAVEQKLAGLETKVGALKNRASAMESRQNGMSHRMDGMNSRMHGLHNRISGLRTSNAGVHVVG